MKEYLKTAIVIIILLVVSSIGFGSAFGYGNGDDPVCYTGADGIRHCSDDPPPQLYCWTINGMEFCDYCDLTNIEFCDCFVGETKVLMAGGISKNINDIVFGDYIVSYNETTKENELSRVIKTFAHENKERMYLLINDVLGVTPNHPMWINGHWLPIGLATVGDTLMDSNGTGVKIDSITKIDKTLPVYNLEVEGNHNYYANGFLAHNKLTLPELTLSINKTNECGGKVLLKWNEVSGSDGYGIYKKKKIGDESSNKPEFLIDSTESLSYIVTATYGDEFFVKTTKIVAGAGGAVDIQSNSVQVNPDPKLYYGVNPSNPCVNNLVLKAITSPVCGGKIRLSWNKLTDAIRYNVLKNGQQITTTTDTSIDVEAKATDIFTVAAIF